ncbi:MAG TPA: tetratricopeptide repeat protein [Fimbriiglobus sp.]|jgi:predicted Zn-dependent protease|nr:tetratricopeptide repeat protein [Fimbriiglobus sp.]
MTRAPTSPTRRRLALWVGGVLALVGLAAVGYFLVWPALELSAAEDALRRHDPAAARARLDHYLARHPGDAHALLLAAQAARRSDQCADAERFLTAFEEAAGASDASKLEWTLLGAQQGDFAGKEDRLRADAGRNSPDAPAVLEALAKGYDASFRWPDATAALDRLLTLEPDHAVALTLRGTIADRLRKPDDAEKDFRRAVELTPDSPATRLALAGLLTRRGHTREALRNFEQVLQARPGDPAALLGLARAHFDASDLDGTQQRLDELLAADPDHADALVDRGRLDLRRERPADAEPFLRKAVAAAPWHRDGHRLLLLTLKEQKRTDDAARCEARLAELTAEDGVGGRLKLRARDNPGDVAVRWELWQWSRRNGQTGDGIAWLTEVLRAEPKHPQAHAALADYFETSGQPRRAAQHRDMAR